MTFLAPVYLLLAGVATTLLVAAHFITRHRPPRVPLPTARFIPESAVRITARSYRLTDGGLLALRALLLFALGAALAGPIVAPERRPVARVILADLSGAVADVGDVRDSAAALLGSGDLLIVFDSTARLLELAGAESLPELSTTDARGSITVAFAAGLRAAASLRSTADSVELVLISPLLQEQLDAATFALRAMHGGRVRHVAVAAADFAPAPASVELRGDSDDPLRASLGLLGVMPATGQPAEAGDAYAVRLVRAALSAEDSAWARAPAHVLVHWPSEQATLPQRSRTDTIGGVIAGDAPVVASFVRHGDPVPGLAVVARWADGAPAATETRAGDGCLRQVALPVPVAGDLVLRPTFLAFVRELLAPCGGVGRDLSPMHASAVAEIVGDGPLLATSVLGQAAERSPLTPWLLGLALLAAAAELIVRRRSA